MIPANVQKYILKNVQKQCLVAPAGSEFRNTIVIPAFAEFEFLPRTLGKISDNPPECLRDTLVIIVLNNPPPKSCDPAKFADNIKTAEYLKSGKYPSNLNLTWIDAFSPGLEIPPDKGVGMARKIGMDISLRRLDWNGNPLILSLDADTDVEANYIDAVTDFFRKDGKCVGASIYFEHMEGEGESVNLAISRYEILMRYFVWGLEYAGSPYAYHSIGSAMAFPARDYVAAGGMKPRDGGEDFYFLQSLRKIGPIGSITSTTVRPSPRISDRVPFGTGPRIKEFIEGKSACELYNPEIFSTLKDLYDFIDTAEISSFSMESIMKSVPSEVGIFLGNEGFCDVWPGILKNTPDTAEKKRLAFNTWFDALKTLRFIHFCEKQPGNIMPLLEIFTVAAPMLGAFTANMAVATTNATPKTDGLPGNCEIRKKYPAMANLEAVKVLISKHPQLSNAVLDFSSESALLQGMRKIYIQQTMSSN